MIIAGGSRGNWQHFARYLSSIRGNERAELIDIRGVSADDNLHDALEEMALVASGTRCDNFLVHLSVNSRDSEQLTPEQWDQAVDTLERHRGLEGQPRIIVEHEKDGRTHRHVIWSRIDVDTMTAIPDSFDYYRNQDAARELEIAFGHEPVPNPRDGDNKGQDRRPENWEVFRGKDSRIDPREIKAEVTALWHESDSGQAFRAALEDNGYLLCKGDRRDFCIIDPAGDDHSLARRIEGARAADIRARLADLDRDALPSVDEARANNTTLQAKEHEKATALHYDAGAEIDAIRQQGHVEEVSQAGAGGNWWQRAQLAIGRWRESAGEFIKEKIDSWQERIESRRSQEPEREEDGPEISP